MNRLGLAVIVLVIIFAAVYLFTGNLRIGSNSSASGSAPASNQNQQNANQMAGNSSTAQSVPTTNITSTNPTTSTGQAPNTYQFIVASPVNLSQISQISKFRSCVGHDYSGYDVNGSLETNRSMKHYFTPTAAYAFTTGRIEEFAPFNGTITSITAEHTPIGHQVWVADATNGATMAGYPTPGIWTAVFFHMDLVSGLQVGSAVKAGQLIGYANQSDHEYTFDIALAKYSLSTNGFSQILDSIFNHMDAQVLSEFAKYGVNQSNIIISKAYRDANPCVFNNMPPGADQFVNLSS